MSCVQFFIFYCTAVVLISSATRCFTVLHVCCAVLTELHMYEVLVINITLILFQFSVSLVSCLSVLCSRYSFLCCPVRYHVSCTVDAEVFLLIHSLCCLFVGILQLLL